MLAPYRPVTPLDYLNAVREIAQEIALVGLWRNGFFEHAAFYGGTALRIFHGIERYSEDLDFTLIEENASARLESALPAVETELQSWGFEFEAEPKSSGGRTGIESAFLKGQTQVNLLHIGAPKTLAGRFPPGQRIRIKLEMDTTPPPLADTEIRTKLLPIPHQVRLYDLPSLFAGKLHALLCREWKQRVKGRDFYDFVWYVSRNVPVHLAHLEKRMGQSGHRKKDSGAFDREGLLRLLKERFSSVDIKKARDEVGIFLRNPEEIRLWSREFFLDLADRVQVTRGKGTEGPVQ